MKPCASPWNRITASARTARCPQCRAVEHRRKRRHAAQRGCRGPVRHRQQRHQADLLQRRGARTRQRRPTRAGCRRATELDRLRWLDDVRHRDRLEALELIGQTQLRQRIEATVYEVLATYYQLVQLNKAIAVQRESARISRERLTIAEAAKNIGTASGLQVVQAQLDLSTDSASALDLRAQQAATTTRLNALIGRDPATPTVVDADMPVAGTLDLAQIQGAARQANSAVQRARQQQIAADLGVKELRGALFPQVDVFANYGYTKSTSAVGILQSNQALGPDYGARVSIPLFRGFQARSAMEVAKLQREQAALTTEQVELDLEEGVLNAWTTYTSPHSASPWKKPTSPAAARKWTSRWIASVSVRSRAWNYAMCNKAWWLLKDGCSWPATKPNSPSYS
ncbi:MAG: TolC family protein [Flavobacteriales bacterium]|nr:TolC family protein [Flavobacteriales bacterium]